MKNFIEPADNFLQIIKNFEKCGHKVFQGFNKFIGQVF